MQDLVELSAKVKSICERHFRYVVPAKRCIGCPIAAECSAPCGPGAAALNEHTTRINAAAEAVK